jgi:hypothetical protein
MSSSKLTAGRKEQGMKIDTYSDNAVVVLTLLGECYFDCYLSADPPMFFLTNNFTATATENDWRELIAQLDDNQLFACITGLTMALANCWSDRFHPAVVALLKEVSLRSWGDRLEAVSKRVTLLLKRYYVYADADFHKAEVVTTIPWDRICLKEIDPERARRVKQCLAASLALRRARYDAEKWELRPESEKVKIEEMLKKYSKISLAMADRQ